MEMFMKMTTMKVGREERKVLLAVRYLYVQRTLPRLKLLSQGVVQHKQHRLTNKP
jgi:hypothetical protein